MRKQIGWKLWMSAILSIVVFMSPAHAGDIATSQPASNNDLRERLRELKQLQAERYAAGTIGDEEATRPQLELDIRLRALENTDRSHASPACAGDVATNQPESYNDLREQLQKLKQLQAKKYANNLIDKAGLIRSQLELDIMLRELENTSRPSAYTAYTIDVRAFGAKNDGSEDASGAIQAALNAASDKGGTVLLGPGRFRLDHELNIPENVMLVGIWEAPHYNALNRGTVIEAYAGKGQYGLDDKGRYGWNDKDKDGKENKEWKVGPALITLHNSSGVRGITFYYPEQRLPDAIPYPWTVKGTGKHGSVIDCTFVNSYEAIAFGPDYNELHYIRNCFGCPLKTGVFIDGTTDIGRIENVHFNPNYWGQIDNPNKPNWDHLMNYLSKNFVAFEFGRTDWEYVINTFCYGANIGYKFVSRNNGTVNGNFLGIGADWCERAVLVENCQMPGLLITNGEFVGSSNTDAILEVKNTCEGPVQLSNCSFWGPANSAAIVDGRGGSSVSFSQCIFECQGKDSGKTAMIDARNGNLVVQACRFRREFTHIRIGDSVDTAVIVGNWFNRQQSIENKSGGDVQIGLNVVGNRKK